MNAPHLRPKAEKKQLANERANGQYAVILATRRTRPFEALQSLIRRREEDAPPLVEESLGCIAGHVWLIIEGPDSMIAVDLYADEGVVIDRELSPRKMDMLLRIPLNPYQYTTLLQDVEHYSRQRMIYNPVPKFIGYNCVSFSNMLLQNIGINIHELLRNGLPNGSNIAPSALLHRINTVATPDANYPYRYHDPQHLMHGQLIGVAVIESERGIAEVYQVNSR